VQNCNERSSALPADRAELLSRLGYSAGDESRKRLMLSILVLSHADNVRAFTSDDLLNAA
jgi:hypothetical protein